MTSLNLKIRVDAKDKKNFEKQKLSSKIGTNTLKKIVCEKLKEAEFEMNKTSKRYSKEEVLESINHIID